MVYVRGLPAFPDIGLPLTLAARSAGKIPDPARFTCTPPGFASLKIVRVPNRVPPEEGLNETLTLHDVPGATAAGQVVPVMANSPGGLLPRRVSEMCNGKLPVLEIVTDCAGLVVPTGLAP